MNRKLPLFRVESPALRRVLGDIVIATGFFSVTYPLGVRPVNDEWVTGVRFDEVYPLTAAACTVQREARIGELVGVRR